MFYILEIQQFPDGHWSEFQPHMRENEMEALSKWHEIMSYAAVSTQPVHGCVIIAGNGATVKTGSYEHPQTTTTPDPEPEPEPEE